MFKRLYRNKLLLNIALFPSLADTEYESLKKYQGLYIEDDWERLKTIFKMDNFGRPHPEMEYTFQMIQYGFFFGLFCGGSYESLKSTKEFIRTNDANVYMTRNEALRTVSRVSSKAFAVGALKYAPKFTVFFGGFTLISSCCEVYRNKTGILENTIAGTAVGAFFRSNLGIKGMISGGVVGGVLGTIYGILTLALFKIANTNKVELKYAAVAYERYKEKLRKENLERLGNTIKEKILFKEVESINHKELKAEDDSIPTELEKKEPEKTVDTNLIKEETQKEKKETQKEKLEIQKEK